MGGSFDPAHAGHAEVAAAALVRLGLDQVWWVVSPGNPLKETTTLSPLAVRMAAARRLAPSPRIRVTGFEAHLGSPYTAETLAYLTRRLPGVRFVWIMGADNLVHFHRWRDWRRIARSVPIVVMDRPGWRLRALASKAAHTLARYRVAEAASHVLAFRPPPAWMFLTIRLSPLSSTALRRRKS